MKRISATILALAFFYPLINGQTIDDALRLSQNQLGGSARFISMGGAFGSLGGDLTTLSYNPAGLGVFQRSEFSFSPGISYNSTTAGFLGNDTEDFKYNFAFNNLGTVLSFQPGSGMVKNVNFGLAFNRLNDFNQFVRIEGFNPTGSLVDYFFFNPYVDGNITGLDPEDLDPFWERLAFDAYVIDTIPGTDFEYTSPVPLGVDMSKRLDSYGRNSEWTISMGTNLMHKLYLGATIGIQSFDYGITTVHREDWTEGASSRFFSFRRELSTNATGYNFKMGFIYRPIDLIRIGGAFHTPTFFRVDDEYFNSMQSSYVTGSVVPTDNDGYQLPADYFNYRLVSPFRAIGSIGLQLKQFGLVSVDYEFVDYASMRFREGKSDADFNADNDNIRDTYRSVSNIRTGAEFKLGVFALRGGFAFYGSPYLKGLENEDAFTTSISAGIGIREKNYYFDMGFVRSNFAERHFLYEGEDNGAYLESNTSRFVASIGIRF